MAWLFLASLAYQVYLIGLYLFAGASPQAHIDFGYSGVALLALLLLVTAIAGRLPRRAVGWAVLVLLDYVVQTALAAARASYPGIAALHPVNALVLFWLTLVVIRHARAYVPAPFGTA